MGARKAGLSQMAGYSASMVLLAVASLIMIPSLIRAGGAAGWGSIALGQAVGAIAAVVVGYGWQISGPARVAVADPAVRRVEYVESVLVRSVLYVPAAVISAVIAVLISPGSPILAVAGALSAAVIGLRANWYFVGIKRPYVLLLTETVPRVLGTVVGVIVLELGAPALAGILLQFAGSVAACLIGTWWILRSHRSTERRPRRSIRTVLIEHRHGLNSSLTSAIYVAAPTIIVSAIAPAVQPVYVLADKVQRQVSIALNPAVTVAQGWVPHANPAIRRQNAVRTLVGGAAVAAFSAAVLLVAGPTVIRLLGAGTVRPGFAVIALMAVFVGINLYESFVARGVLAALDELRAVARVTLVSSIIGLIAVAVGAVFFGVIGALSGVVGGLLLRVLIELIVAVRALRRLRADHPAPDAPLTAAAAAAGDGAGEM